MPLPVLTITVPVNFLECVVPPSGVDPALSVGPLVPASRVTPPVSPPETEVQPRKPFP